MWGRIGLENTAMIFGGLRLFLNLLFTYDIKQKKTFSTSLILDSFLSHPKQCFQWHFESWSLSFIEMKILCLFEELGEEVLYQYSDIKVLLHGVNTNKRCSIFRFHDFIRFR